MIRFFGFVFRAVTTVAGVVLTLVGTIPVVGETVEHDGVQMTVETIDRRAIARVRVTPAPQP